MTYSWREKETRKEGIDIYIGTIGIALQSERIVIANLDLISLPREKETRAKNSCRLSLARPSVHVHTMERPIVPNPCNIEMIQRRERSYGTTF